MLGPTKVNPMLPLKITIKQPTMIKVVENKSSFMIMIFERRGRIHPLTFC